jgi:hypothetical protein
MGIGTIFGSAAAGAGTGAMIGGPWGAAIGGGIGLGAGMLQSKEQANKEQRQRELAASTQEFSPWTGLQAQPVEEVSDMQNLFSGALTGAQMYGMGKMGAANQANLAKQDALLSAQTKFYENAGRAPASVQAPSFYAPAPQAAVPSQVTPEIQAMYMDPRFADIANPQVAMMQESQWLPMYEQNMYAQNK